MKKLETFIVILEVALTAKKKGVRNNFQALEIYVQANFSSKRVCRCLHIQKASERKINENDNFSSKRVCRCLHIQKASERKINEDDNFSSKRVCRCLHIHKASERKINEVNKVCKLCFGAPEMFSASQNYLSVPYPPKSGGNYVFIANALTLYASFMIRIII